MHYYTIFVSSLLSLLPGALAHPGGGRPNNTLPQQYTLTAYAPNDRTYNGLKVQAGGGLNIFQAQVGSYCPLPPEQCPNGTETVFAGTLFPLSLVPGGQELYVAYDGQIQITTQHSHSFPPNSYPYYYGWTWTPLPLHQRHHLRGCPRSDPLYNCSAPSGVFNFHAPDAAPGVGGVMACPNPYDPAATKPTRLYAVTPGFVKAAGCVELAGLGTHEYAGVSPPVWAY